MKTPRKSNVARPLPERLAEATGEDAPPESPPPPNTWFGLKGSLRIGDGLDPIEFFGPAAPAAAFSRKAGVGPRAKARSAPSPPIDLTHYTEALLKLFPIEGVTLAPLVPAIAGGNRSLTYALVGVIIGLIIFLRAVATQPERGGKPDWSAVSVSVISFLLYASTLEIFGLFLKPAERHVLLMSFVTIVWLAVVPRLPVKRKTHKAKEGA